MDDQQQARFLDALFVHSKDAIISTDCDACILAWNPAAESIYGFSANEAVGQSIDLIVPPDRRDEITAILERLRTEGLITRFETLRRRKDGTLLHLSLQVLPVHDGMGEMIGQISVGTNITQQVDALQQLRRTTAEFETIFGSLKVLIAYLDRDFNFIRVNAAYAAAEGKPPEFFPGKNHFALYPNAENEAIFHQVVASGVPFRVAKKPFLYGEHLERGISWWDWSLEPIKDPDGAVNSLVLILLDVTESVETRLQLETTVRELRLRTSQMERAEQMAGLGYWYYDLRSGTGNWSDGSFQLLGYRPGEVQPTLDTLIEHVDADDRQRIWELAQRFFTEQQNRQELEYRIHRADTGEERYIRAQAEVDCDADGHPVALFGVSEDITARKRIEWELRERFRMMAENVRDVVWVSTPSNQAMVYVNPAYERIWGRSRSELYAHPEQFFEAIHPADREAVMATVSSHGGGEWIADYRIVRPDRSVRWIHDRGFPILDEAGNWSLIVGIASDVTELRQANAALRRKNRELERLNAELEEFAYVASHDLKAPLRAVANLAHWINEDAAERLDPENRDRLALLRERIFRMDRLINGLLTYARLGRVRAEESQPVDLEPLIDELLAELSVPEGFAVNVERPLPTLPADPIQLRQIFQNLISNAIQHHDQPRGTVVVRAREEGEQWLLEVADDGPGIPPAERQSIFKMFTSLGRPGGGGEHTGIGLAVVKKLVLGHGGQIEVTDNVPRGTRFLIHWPKQPLDIHER